jgi:hypothetical protein
MIVFSSVFEGPQNGAAVGTPSPSLQRTTTQQKMNIQRSVGIAITPT